MSCPVVPGQGHGGAPGSELAPLTAAGKEEFGQLANNLARLMVDCSRPLAALNKCQVDPNTSACPEQARCFLGCQKAHNAMVEKVGKSSCVQALEKLDPIGHETVAEKRFIRCLETNTEDACLSGLRNYVECVEKEIRSN